MPQKNNFFLLFPLSIMLLSGCAGGMKNLKVVDYTDKRVMDLILTKKVIGKSDFLFFSSTKMGLFLEGNIQGMITDYAGNPIEGVTVKAVSDRAKGTEEDLNPIEETANAFVTLSFTPGITDNMGVYKVKFSLPVIDNEVDVRGKLIYNPGWDQQKLNLGKAYEPQTKESSFRIYYNMNNGFLAFGEGIRTVIVQPVGEGQGRLKSLPGSQAPQPSGAAKQPASSPSQTGAAPGTPANPEEDIFKAFNF